jgi:hypothetical protein
VQLEKTAVSARPAAEAPGLTATLSDAGTHLPLSRKFDSAAALRRLTERAASGGTSGRRGLLRRLLRYPGRLTFVVAVVAAGAGAYYIAYYY